MSAYPERPTDSGEEASIGPTLSEQNLPVSPSHRGSAELPPLPQIPRANSRFTPKRPASSARNPSLAPAVTTSNTSPSTAPKTNPQPSTTTPAPASASNSGFTPVQRSTSRLSTRSTQTFLDAPVTITAQPEIRRQETQRSVQTIQSIRSGKTLGNRGEKRHLEHRRVSEEAGDGDGGEEVVGQEEKVVQVAPDGTEITFPDGGKEAWMVVLGGVFALFCGFGLTAALGGFQTYYSYNLIPQYPTSTIAWITGVKVSSTQAFITFGLAAFTGSLFDKVGHKPLVLSGTILSGLGLILLGFCTQYWHLFLVHAIPIGIGNNLIFISPMGVVGQWFSRRRGLAFGLLTAGASLGSVIWPLMVAKLPPLVGFPWTVRIMGFLTLGLGMAAFFLLKTRLPPKPPGPFFYFDAFRKVPYCCVAISAFTYVLSFFSFLTFIGTFGQLAGLGDYAPYLLIIANGASAFGRISLGIAADYVGPYNITTFSVLLMAIFYWLWIALRSTPGLTAFAIIFGFWSGGYVSQQAPMAAAEADDMRLAGTMVGQVMFFMSFAQLFGGPIFGALLGSGTAEEQLNNAPRAIAMGASMMTLTTGLLAWGRLARSKELWAKV